jgi:inner membrane protein
MLGTLIGHLLMDSLTVMGIPVLTENSKKLVLFGGKIRTGSAGEFAVSGLIAILAFFVFAPMRIGETGLDWKGLYDSQVIDKKEYRENRFKLF